MANIQCEISTCDSLILVAPLLFTNIFGKFVTKEGIYSRHYLLGFILFMAVPLVDYYLLMKGK